MVCEALAEELTKSRRLLDIYSQCKEMLESVGDMASVVALQNNMHKEHKRMNSIGNESGAVLSALAYTRRAEQEENVKRRRLADEVNRRKIATAPGNYL